MIRKIFTLAVLALLVAGSANAQRRSSGSDYSTGLGIRMDFGSGGGYFGFSAKHFFSAAGAGEAFLLFAGGATQLGFEYQHHFDIPSASGLKWYLGVGPGFVFYSGGAGTSVLVRPVAGLEYTLSQAPINIGFDWRPMIVLTNGSGFEAGRFGLAFRYTLK